MVGARGFEPPASRSRTVRSTKLSYAPAYLRSNGIRGINREEVEDTLSGNDGQG